MKKIVCESCEQRIASHYYRKTNLCDTCLEYAENDDSRTRGTNREDWETEDDEYERQKDLKEIKKKKNPNTWKDEGYGFDIGKIEDHGKYNALTIKSISPSKEVVGKYCFYKNHNSDEIVVVSANTFIAHQRKYLANMAYSMAENILEGKIVADESVGGQTENAKRLHANKNKLFGKKNVLKGGKGDALTVDDVDQNELRIGMMIEMEHTDDKWIALEIVLDHLAEFPDYYTRLVIMENSAKKKIKSNPALFPLKQYSDYNYYSINNKGEVISGWTYKQDALDDKKESALEDRGIYEVKKIAHHSRADKEAVKRFNKRNHFKGNKPTSEDW